jgi:hypothetical protein
LAYISGSKDAPAARSSRWSCDEQGTAFQGFGGFFGTDECATCRPPSSKHSSSLFRGAQDILLHPRRELSHPRLLDASAGIEQQHGWRSRDIESLKFLTEDRLNLQIFLFQETAAGGCVIRHNDEKMSTERAVFFLLAESPVKRHACVAVGTSSADGDYECLWITAPTVFRKRRKSLARQARLIASMCLLL